MQLGRLLVTVACTDRVKPFIAADGRLLVTVACTDRVKPFIAADGTLPVTVTCTDRVKPFIAAGFTHLKCIQWSFLFHAHQMPWALCPYVPEWDTLILQTHKLKITLVEAQGYQRFPIFNWRAIHL